MPEIGVGRIQLAKPQVACDRALKQVGALGHQPYPRPEVLQDVLAHIDPIDTQGACGDVEEAWNQVDHGRLARACATDDGGGLTRPHGER